MREHSQRHRVNVVNKCSASQCKELEWSRKIFTDIIFELSGAKYPFTDRGSSKLHRGPKRPISKLPKSPTPVASLINVVCAVVQKVLNIIDWDRMANSRPLSNTPTQNNILRFCTVSLCPLEIFLF